MFAPLVATVSILVVFIVLQFVSDAIRAKRLKRVTEGLLNVGKQQSLAAISVVVKARGSRQQVTDLLDHLASFNYEQLQVIVIPRSRQRNRSDDYLALYRSAHPAMNLRIVRSGRRDDKTIATRHARGELVLWMDLSERLSPRFFELASYEFANPVIDRVDAPYRLKTARTIADLLATWSVIRAGVIGATRSKLSGPHPIYRRKSFKNGASPVVSVKAGTQIAFIRPRSSSSMWNAVVIISNLLVTMALGYVALYYLSTQWLFTVLAIVCAYLLSNLFWLISSKRYSLSEAAGLVLALPFALVGSLAVRFKRS